MGDGIQTLHFHKKDTKALSTIFVPSQVHKSVVTQSTPFNDDNAVHFTLNTTFPKSKCHQNDPFDPFSLSEKPILSNVGSREWSLSPNTRCTLYCTFTTIPWTWTRSKAR